MQPLPKNAERSSRPRRVLVTGAAGFIGFFVSQALLERGHEVLGIDNLNDYYEVSLKEARLAVLSARPGFAFLRADIADRQGMDRLFDGEHIDAIVHLAAQAGVRHSISNPRAYVDCNLVGFANVLEGARRARVAHLVFASSSSVYGANTKMPFSVHHNVDHPVSLYAATKKSGELMAHAYASLFGLPATGLRFFTVYGPWGRPDMAYFSFTRAIIEGRPIDVFGEGRMRRDFTFIDDVAGGVLGVLDRPPVPSPAWDRAAPDPSSSFAPYRIYNIGNHSPVELMEFIGTLEDLLGKKAIKNMLPMQPGDVPATYADIADLAQDTGFAPSTPLREGLSRFVSWYKEYYKIAL